MLVFKYNFFLQIFSLIAAINFLAEDNISAVTRKLFKDPFIEDVFEVKIPGMKGAYNPSLVEFGDGYLMAFRYDTFKLPRGQHIKDFHQHIGLVLLDKNFKPKGPWQHCIGYRTYDPRLMKVGDTIYMIYASPAPTDIHSVISSRLNLCTIIQTENEFSISEPKTLHVSFQRKWEKNWVLFSYENQVLLEYTISPHVILHASLEDGSCTHLAFEEGDQKADLIEWPYGQIRGGTPALLVDGKYLGFFHSSHVDTHTKKYTYYIGAYTFQNSPPFTVEKISKTPFSHPDFYSTPHTPKTDSQVIFPGGFVMKKNKIFLIYGENDDAIKIMAINKKKLYNSMRTLKK